MIWPLALQKNLIVRALRTGSEPVRERAEDGVLVTKASSPKAGWSR
jgi:hypothetical protein